MTAVEASFIAMIALFNVHQPCALPILQYNSSILKPFHAYGAYAESTNTIFLPEAYTLDRDEMSFLPKILDHEMAHVAMDCTGIPQDQQHQLMAQKGIYVDGESL